MNNCVKIFSIIIILLSFISCVKQETNVPHLGKNTQSLIMPQEESIRKTIEFDNVKLSYVVRSGDGPTLILIPGSFSDANQWNEVIPVLGKDLNLILIEIRGHGKSWPPPIDGTIEQLAKDVILVADNEKLGHFYVGGHSIGGMISKEVGHSWPQRVYGVISIEGWTHWQASRDAFNYDMKSTLTPEQKKKRLMGRELATGHWTKEQLSDFAAIWRKWERGEDFLQNTNLPIIEIYGDRSKIHPSLKQLYIPNRPNIEVHWINNASHSLPLEKPREIALVINEFIKKIESGKK